VRRAGGADLATRTTISMAASSPKHRVGAEFAEVVQAQMIARTRRVRREEARENRERQARMRVGVMLEPNVKEAGWPSRYPDSDVVARVKRGAILLEDLAAAYRERNRAVGSAEVREFLMRVRNAYTSWRGSSRTSFRSISRSKSRSFLLRVVCHPRRAEVFMRDYYSTRRSSRARRRIARRLTAPPEPTPA